MKDCFIVVRFFNSDMSDIVPLCVFVSRQDAVAYIAHQKASNHIFNLFIIESNLYENYGR